MNSVVTNPPPPPFGTELGALLFPWLSVCGNTITPVSSTSCTISDLVRSECDEFGILARIYCMRAGRREHSPVLIYQDLDHIPAGARAKRFLSLPTVVGLHCSLGNALLCL